MLQAKWQWASQVGHRVVNLNTEKIIACVNFATIPATTTVKRAVKNMAVKQNVVNVELANKKGIEWPDADWIAGVDHEHNWSQDNKNNKNNNNEDGEDQDCMHLINKPTTVETLCILMMA